MTKVAMLESPWSNHIRIAIRCWARDWARFVRDKVLKIPPTEMEDFIAELLTDALTTFDGEYNSACNEYICQLERFVEDVRIGSVPAPLPSVARLTENGPSVSGPVSTINETQSSDGCRPK